MKKNIPSDQDNLQQTKAVLELQFGRPVTEEEVQAAHDFFNLLAGIVVDATRREASMLKKLEEFPGGFHPDEAGSCKVCGTHTQKEQCWFDANGLKCLYCQKAIDHHIIPVSEGVLKRRQIAGSGKHLHLELFLVSENEKMLNRKSG